MVNFSPLSPRARSGWLAEIGSGSDQSWCRGWAPVLRGRLASPTRHQANAKGAAGFLGRVYRFVTRNADQVDRNQGALTDADRAVLRKLHQTLKKVTDDFESRWHFNTSIASIMELVNELYATEDRVARTPSSAIPVALMADVQRNLVLLLAPFAPYLAHELWEMLGEKENLLRAPWPKYDPALAKEEEIEIPVQVNGKLRSRILVPADARMRPGLPG